MGAPVGFGANLLAIISAFKDPKELVAKLRGPSKRQKVLTALLPLLLVLILGIIIPAQASFSGAFISTITQVMRSDYSLSMSTGDAGALSATVLYSDNTESSDVLWVSSNKSVSRLMKIAISLPWQQAAPRSLLRRQIGSQRNHL